MTEQPEALRLADELENGEYFDVGSTDVAYGWMHDDPTPSESADELRRLHAENERLRKVPKWFHCDTHGQGNLNAWGCPECVRELRNENERLREAVLAEREACAKLAGPHLNGEIAAAIRARGET